MIMGMRRPLAAASARREQAKRGFTLTEIAIVLGIIGLILGAIWVAAAAVYSNLKVSKATTELLDIVQNVRAMYATSATVDPAADMPGAFGALTPGGATAAYVGAGVFPIDTLNTGSPTTATAVTDPWSGGIAIEHATINVADDSFQVIFDKVPTNGCVALLTSNTGGGRDPDMQFATAGAAGAYPGANAGVIPVLASVANADCKLATNAVSFTFLLK